jgi:hypothetical protein
MHIGKVGMKIPDNGEELLMFVTKLGHFLILLAIPCLQLHDIAVRCTSNIVTFGSQYCTIYCHNGPLTVQGVTEEPPKPDCQERNEIFQ